MSALIGRGLLSCATAVTVNTMARRSGTRRRSFMVRMRDEEESKIPRRNMARRVFAGHDLADLGDQLRMLRGHIARLGRISREVVKFDRRVRILLHAIANPFPVTHPHR